jgi:hypothetical protein
MRASQLHTYELVGLDGERAYSLSIVYGQIQSVPYVKSYYPIFHPFLLFGVDFAGLTVIVFLGSFIVTVFGILW